LLKRVKILSDNSVCELFSCLAEHGFSAYVETTEGRYLFDTGRGDVVVRNAEALDVDLTRLNAIIISHGHYDHTGGLELVLGTTGSIDVYGHPAIFDDKWLIKKDFKKDIGIPATREQLEKLGARFHLSTAATQISGDTWLSGQIARQPGFESIDSELYVKHHGQLVLDKLPDDQAMYVTDSDGINIILGCTHSTIENTLMHITKTAKMQNIKLLIGGLHLFKSDQQTIAGTIETIRKYEIAKIGVSHCTGLKAMALLQTAFGDKFEIAAVGSSFSVSNQ
jgi:7,8-dihydropterin-6-yl-methyl-4-(beta-D-ribofuranosyl)aminobenzene 5'-phosphate synthase